jgi:hypothetical protein
LVRHAGGPFSGSRWDPGRRGTGTAAAPRVGTDAIARYQKLNASGLKSVDSREIAGGGVEDHDGPDIGGDDLGADNPLTCHLLFADRGRPNTDPVGRLLRQRDLFEIGSRNALETGGRVRWGGRERSRLTSEDDQARQCNEHHERRPKL